MSHWYRNYQHLLENDLSSWFGNSQVLDHNEEPMPCYHGTGRNFDEFDSGWWSPNIKTAKEFGHKIYKAYLKIERPAEEEDLVAAYNELFDTNFTDYHDAGEDAYTTLADYVAENPKFRALLISKGYDGLCVFDDTNHNEGTVYVPFYPERQVRVIDIKEVY